MMARLRSDCCGASNQFTITPRLFENVIQSSAFRT